MCSNAIIKEKIKKCCAYNILTLSVRHLNAIKSTVGRSFLGI